MCDPVGDRAGSPSEVDRAVSSGGAERVAVGEGAQDNCARQDGSGAVDDL
jgi:hypothetical protein